MARSWHLAAIAAVLALLGVGLAACGDGAVQSTPSASPSASVVARVDGEPVTKADVDAVRAELRFAGDADEEQAARDEAIRRLLVRREAERLAVTVSHKAVEARLAALAESLGGEEALSSVLAAADMSQAQLQAAVRYSLLEGALAAELFPDKRPDGGDIAAFYRRQRATLFTKPAKVRLRGITVPAESMASRVAAEIDGGLGFADAAQRYSMDEETRYEGGMLGWVLVASLPQEVAVAIEDLPARGVSAPVESFGRWHLYQVLDRRRARTLPLSKVREEIREELTRRLRAQALDEWLGNQLERATFDTSP